MELGPGCLLCKKSVPKTRPLYSLHNYKCPLHFNTGWMTFLVAVLLKQFYLRTVGSALRVSFAVAVRISSVEKCTSNCGFLIERLWWFMHYACDKNIAVLEAHDRMQLLNSTATRKPGNNSHHTFFREVLVWPARLVD